MGAVIRVGGPEDRQGAEFIYCLAALRACAVAPPVADPA
jgi:hypothetical protein